MHSQLTLGEAMADRIKFQFEEFRKVWMTHHRFASKFGTSVAFWEARKRFGKPNATGYFVRLGPAATGQDYARRRLLNWAEAYVAEHAGCEIVWLDHSGYVLDMKYNSRFDGPMGAPALGWIANTSSLSQ